MRRSENVQDRRGRGGIALGGGVGVIVVLVVAVLLGADPSEILRLIGGASSSSVEAPARPSGAEDRERAFVSAILGSTEDVWGRLFADRGARYDPPTLVLFDDAVRSACGFQSAAVGPFYCPPDQKLYLDTSFFEQLRRFGAPGDFAQAYVVAHEVGHHVQNLLGIADQVAQERRSASREEANALQVLMELQADCFAGVWAHHAAEVRNRLEPGDVEEGLQAAAAIGDDRMQRRATGSVQPESWTHGSSEMRQNWLRRGMETGDVEACDTFGAR